MAERKYDREELRNYLRIIVEPVQSYLKLLDKCDVVLDKSGTGELFGLIAIATSICQAVDHRIDNICDVIERDLGDVEVDFYDYFEYTPVKATLKSKAQEVSTD